MRILLADDDQVALEVFRAALDRQVHVVQTVTTGQAALEVFSRHAPEIVCLDWTLPGVNGLNVARKIRRLEGSEPRAVILLATAFDDASIVAEALEAGVDDYMLKPITRAEVRARFAIAGERYHGRAAVRHREARMRQAMDRAEAVSRVRAEFLANMSHELRTPLHGIVGMSDVLLRGELSDAQREAAELIQASARRLDNTINDVLELSGVDQHRVRIEAVPMDLRVVVDETVELFRDRARRQRLSLKLDYPRTLPSVLIGDPVRLRQVITQLLNNALVFTQEGGVLVRVEPVEVAEDAARMRISVTDTGVGIEVERQAALFGEDVHGDLTRGRSRGGRGFGLPVCRDLVALMDGDIGVKSAPGEGSTFWMELLMAVPEHALAMMHEAPKENRAGLHALVVEDNPVSQRVARRTLETMGCRVTLADNGRQALDLMSRTLPQVIFMDIDMPEMDGLEATQKIRALGWQLPIVGVSASSVRQVRDKCMRVGMNHYLEKPVRLENLQEALQTVLPDTPLSEPPAPAERSGPSARPFVH